MGYAIVTYSNCAPPVSPVECMGDPSQLGMIHYVPALFRLLMHDIVAGTYMLPLMATSIIGT